MTLSALFPEGAKPAVQKKLSHAGIEEDLEIWVGRAMTVTLLFSMVFFLAPLILFRYQPAIGQQIGIFSLGDMALKASLPLFIAMAVIIPFLYFIYLFYRIQARTDTIEKVLPDFLLIMVSNLHAGMFPFSAFVGAARPEFGPLEEEVKKVAARTSASQSLSFALTDLSGRFDSPIFRKTILFFEKAVRSGGQMAKILHASAEEIRHTQEMREELLSQTRSYIIFMAFMIVLVAPFLLSISGQFLGMFLKIKAQATQNSSGAFDIPLFKGEILITTGFVDSLSIAFLVLAGLFISFFIGTIMRGKMLYGVKYFPLIAIASVIMYFISNSIVSGLLASFG